MRQHLWQRFRWLAFGTAIVLLARVGVWLYDGEAGDPYIVTWLAVGLALAVVIQFVFTDEWDLKAAGTFYATMGTAWLAIAALINFYDPQSSAWLEASSDWVRALWIAGITMMVAGAVLYLLGRWRQRKNPDRPP